MPRAVIVLQIALIVLCLGAMVWAGTVLRHNTWQRSEVLRYVPDMLNGWNWGSRAAKEGYFDLYRKVAEKEADKEKPNYGLDYVPLRLAVMTLWAQSRLAQEPAPNSSPNSASASWQGDYAFNAPLLRFNAVMELLAAAGIFAIARQWSRRDDARRGIARSWLRAEWLALIAFALVWFNPASFLSGHARPTWDVWVAPFFVWAIWCCCRNLWLTAGVLLAVGAMLKGQQLVVAPMFLLWPLMGFRVGAAARFLIGFVLAAALIVSPWIIGPHAGPIVFVLLCGLLPLIAWGVLKRWPVQAWSMPARWLRWSIPAMTALGLVAGAWLFGGSMDWFRISILYGADKFSGLEVGGASSLAGILQNVYGWRADDVVGDLNLYWTVVPYTISHILIAGYGLCMVISTFAMHRFERLGDARFVLAMAAPWIVYFAIFPKMHERYLLWGALCACTAVIIGMGPTLLAVFFSLCSTVMSLYQMLPGGARANRFMPEWGDHFGSTLHYLIRPTFPGLGWAILLATGVWLWMVTTGAITARRARPKEEPKPDALQSPEDAAITGLP